MFNSASGRSCATELLNDLLGVVTEGFNAIQYSDWQSRQRRVSEPGTGERKPNVIAQRICNRLNVDLETEEYSGCDIFVDLFTSHQTGEISFLQECRDDFHDLHSHYSPYGNFV
jgi:hypothetical protein